MISQSDFYLYDTKAKTWTLICDDTSQEDGPSLVFDHQMCIDIAKRNIYVFGGRILSPRNVEVLQNETCYSGLYSYHIPTNTWTQILVDCAHPTASNPEVMSIKSRVTHCMLFHHVSCLSNAIIHLKSGRNNSQNGFYVEFLFSFAHIFSGIANCTYLAVNAIKIIQLILLRLMLTHKIYRLSIPMAWNRTKIMCHSRALRSVPPSIVNVTKSMCCR